LSDKTRRRFLIDALSAMAGATALFPSIATAAADTTQPSVRFPEQPRERIAIASYPFRDYVTGRKDVLGGHKLELKDFSAHVAEKFNIRKIEPWSEHFRSLDHNYLQEIRTGVEKAGGMIVNIAVDGEHSPYAADKGEREKSVVFSKQWVDAAAVVGSPSIRNNMPKAADSEPDAQRAADTLSQLAEYAAKKNILVNMENDNPVSEDPFFIEQVIEKVNNPWLHALPDFANSLTTGREEHAYQGLQRMFAHAYNICHVKALEVNDQGKEFRVDMAKTFGILRAAHYKGYCSMEFDSPGDPYKGTSELIDTTLKYLS
jgi:sugar phosphate isomerase/epimerase